MTDKKDTMAKDPITEFANTLTSNSKIAGPPDYADNDDLHLVPLKNLFNDNDETKSEK